MNYSHEQLQKLAKRLILFIWLGGGLSIFLLLFWHYDSQSFSVQPNAYAPGVSSTVGMDLPTPDIAAPYKMNTLFAEPSTAVETELLVFHSKKCFLRYFEAQYSADELLQEYNAAIIKSGVSNVVPEKIVVQKQSKKLGERFDQQFNVKVKFDIKPVPQ